MADEKKDETATDAEIVTPEAPKSNKLVFILLPVLLIVGVLAGFVLSPVMHSMFGGKKEEKTPHDTEESGEHAADSSKKEIDPKNIIFVEIPQILVNLKTDKKARPVFLKVSISLESHEHEAKEVVEALRPKMIDQMQTFFRDLGLEDVTGANNLQRIRRELLTRLNSITAPHKIEDVLITEFLVQ